jgi:hypothetical protein
MRLSHSRYQGCGATSCCCFGHGSHEHAIMQWPLLYMAVWKLVEAGRNSARCQVQAAASTVYGDGLACFDHVGFVSSQS